MIVKSQEAVILNRDCEAIAIPSGQIFTLFKGTRLTITQALGGTYTVMTDQGALATVPGKDADALGKEIPETPQVPASGEEQSTEKLIWDQLRTCYDPEIPHNIVDLGLVYECKISDLSEGGKRVDIKMTLTAPGCGMGDWLKVDARNKLMTVPGVQQVNVDVVFDPPWDPSKMSKALRRALNMM